MRKLTNHTDPNSGSRKPLPFPGLTSNCAEKPRQANGPKLDHAGVQAKSHDKLSTQIEVVETGRDEPLQLGDILSPRFFKRQSGFLISFLVHAFFLFVLSLVLIQVGTGRPILVLEALVEQVSDFEQSVADIQIDASSDLFDLSGDDGELESDDFDAFVVSSNSIATFEHDPATGSKRYKRGDGNSTEFFGTRIDGNSFVFIVDQSGSMEATPDGFTQKAVTRFQAAKDELMRSVGQLSEDQEFYVLLFSQRTQRMFGDKSAIPKPVRATIENKEKLEEWLSYASIQGGTDPRDSLDLALKMQPDAIFMLSDGEFGAHVPGSADGSLEIVQNNNVGSVAIHTIALEDTRSKQNMMEIADASGGEFRFVTIFSQLQYLLASPDAYDHRIGLGRVKMLEQLEWQVRFEIANQSIDILANADPETQSLAAETLHWLSFDLLQSRFDEVTGGTSKETIIEMAQNWRISWQLAEQIVQQARRTTPDDEMFADVKDRESFSLALMGDYQRHKSLRAIRALSQRLPGDEKSSQFAKSLKKFQSQFSRDDPFFQIAQPGLENRAPALNRLLTSSMTWNERYLIANVHMIPMLSDTEAKSREFAKDALHRLSFESFRIPADEDPNPVDKDDIKHDTAEQWQHRWSQVNDLVNNKSQPDEKAELSIEHQLLLAYGTFVENGNLDEIERLVSETIDVVRKIAIARSVISFQGQYGVNGQDKTILMSICGDLANNNQSKQRAWSRANSYQDCEGLLEQCLRQRDADAKKMYRSWLRMPPNSYRRPGVQQRLIERYPDTKYAKMVTK